MVMDRSIKLRAIQMAKGKSSRSRAVEMQAPKETTATASPAPSPYSYRKNISPVTPPARRGVTRPVKYPA